GGGEQAVHGVTSVFSVRREGGAGLRRYLTRGHLAGDRHLSMPPAAKSARTMREKRPTPADLRRTCSMKMSLALATRLFGAACGTAAAQDKVDLGKITERHVMIPMRDGKRLSAYLYFPPGPDSWPAVFEQRYADLRGAGTRQAAAKLAEAGFVVALV